MTVKHVELTEDSGNDHEHHEHHDEHDHDQDSHLHHHDGSSNLVSSPSMPALAAHVRRRLQISRPALQTRLRRVKGLAFMAASAAVFSVVSLFASLTVEAGVSPFEVAFMRFLGQSLTTSVFFVVNRSLPVVKRPQVPFMVGRCVGGTLSVTFFYMALARMHFADVTVLFFTNPVMTSVVAHFLLKEPFGKWDALSVVFCMTGAVLVVEPPFLFKGAETTPDQFLGGTYAMLGAFTATLSMISLRMLKTTHSMTSTMYHGLSGLVGNAIFGLFAGPAWTMPENWVQAFLLCTSGALGCLGQNLLARGMQLESAGPAAMMRYLDIVLAFIFQVTIEGHSVKALSVLGAVLVVACTVFMALKRSQEATQGGTTPIPPATPAVEATVIVEMTPTIPQPNAQDTVQDDHHVDSDNGSSPRT